MMQESKEIPNNDRPGKLSKSAQKQMLKELKLERERVELERKTRLQYGEMIHSEDLIGLSEKEKKREVRYMKYIEAKQREELQGLVSSKELASIQKDVRSKVLSTRKISKKKQFGNKTKSANLGAHLPSDEFSIFAPAEYVKDTSKFVEVKSEFVAPDKLTFENDEAQGHLARKAYKEAEKKIFNDRKKNKSLLVKEARQAKRDLDVSNEAHPDEVGPVKLKEKKTVVRGKGDVVLSKEELQAIRKANMRRKKFKKESKKLRREMRKAEAAALNEEKPAPAVEEKANEVTELNLDEFARKEEPGKIKKKGRSVRINLASEFFRSPTLVTEAGLESKEEKLHDDMYNYAHASARMQGDPDWTQRLNKLGKSIVSSLTFYFNKDSDIVRECERILHPFILLCYAPNFVSFNSAVNLFFERLEIGGDWVTRNAYSYLVTSFYDRMIGFKAANQLKTEAGVLEFIDSSIAAIDLVTDFTSATLNGHVFKVTRDFFLSLVALQLFPEHLVSTVVGIYGKKEYGGTKQHLFVTLLKAISAMGKMAIRVGKGESLTSVITSDDPFIYNLNMLRDLASTRSMLYAGVPVPGRTSEVEWMTKARDVLPYIDTIKKSFGPMTSERKEIDRLVFEVQQKIRELEVRASTQQRVTPMAIVLCGSPGIGKSKLLDFCLAQISIAMGRKYEPRHVYHRNKAAKHWDMYDPLSQPFIHISELGSQSRNIAQTTEDPCLQEFLSLVDSVPFPVTQAAVEDKGKVFALPEVVIADTNNPELHLSTQLYCPDAALRRMVFIHPTVLPEYRKSDSLQIDPEKAAEAKDAFDVWSFEVVEYKVGNKEKANAYTVVSNGDIRDLATYLYRKTKQHVDNERNILDRIGQADAFDGYLNVEVGLEFKMPNVLQTCFMEIHDSFLSLGYAACKYSVLSYAEKSHHLKENLSFWLCNLMAFILCCHVITSALLGAGLGLILSVFLIFRFVPNIINESLARQKNVEYDRFLSCGRHILRYFGLLRDNRDFAEPFDDRQYKYKRLALIAASAGAIIGIYFSFFKKKKSYPLNVEASTDFVNESAFNYPINVLEEQASCGQSYKRVPNKLVDSWNVIHPVCENKHTSGQDSLEIKVNKNVRRIICNDVSRNTRWSTMGVGIKGNVMLINTHALKNRSNITLQISTSSYLSAHEQYKEVRVNDSNRKDLGNDLTLVWTNQSFADVEQHFYQGSLPEAFIGKIAGRSVGPHLVRDVTANEGTSDVVHLTHGYSYVYPGHLEGMCGFPLYGTSGNFSYVIGIHFAGWSNSDTCVATIVTRADLARGLSNPPNSLMPIMSQGDIGEAFKSARESVTDSIRTESSEETLFEMPISKSPVHYVNLVSMEYFGKLPGDVMLNDKSRLVRNVFYEKKYDLENKLWEVYNYIPTVRYEKPVMKPVNRHGEYLSPYNYWLTKSNVVKKSLNTRILDECVNEYFSYIISRLPDDIPKLEPLTLKTAVNGVEYDCFIRKLAMNKSAGFGFPRTKGDHMDVVDEKDYEPKEHVKREVARILNCYERGQCSTFIYKTQLKDEPRATEKVEKASTRVFFMSSLPSLIVSRMFLAPIYTLMVQYSRAFCTAIGIDMHRESGTIIEDLGNPEWVGAGDISGFDTNIPFDISWGAATIVSRLASHFGYNSVAMNIVNGVLSDGLFSTIVMNGDVFQVAGLQPSGKYATAEDNSLKNLLMMLYIWKVLPETRGHSFFEHVKVKTYGDDMIYSVSDRFRAHYNDVVLSQAYLEHYGLTYTNTEKGIVVDPFQPVSRCTFLRRTFRYDAELDRIISPLDMDSIFKTLTWRIPSPNVPDVIQINAIVTSVLYELWFHSTREQFEIMRNYLIDCMSDHFQEIDCQWFSTHLPLYDNLKESFMPCHMSVNGEDHSVSDDLIGISDTDDAFLTYQDFDPGLLLEKGLDRPHSSFLRSASLDNLKQLRIFLNKELSELKDLDVKESEIQNKIDEIEDTLKLISRLISEKTKKLSTESGAEIEMKVGEISHVQKEQNVVDTAPHNETKESSIGQSYSLHDNCDADLGDFLERPVEIYSGSIPLNANFDVAMDVWDLFTKSPSIRAKLKNFGLLRGDLQIKIEISGMQFHVGKIQIAYIPFASMIPIVTTYEGDSTMRYGFLQYKSQQKLSKTMDVKYNKPLVFDVKWHAQSPACRLFNRSAIALGDTTSFDEFKDMGRLYVSTLNQVSSVSSGVTTPVYIYIYAYMKNTNISVPTATVMTLTTESGKEQWNGPLSNFCDTATAVSRMGKAVPVLAPYARVGEVVFAGMGKIFSALGLSRPTVITEPSLVKNEPFRNGCNAIASDTDKKLTLDPRQGIVLSYGSEEDEMSFAHIMRREGLFDTFTWGVNDRPDTGPIYSLAVTPCADKAFKIGLTKGFYQPTPLNLLSTLHSYWSGTIIYRFEIVASGFHRGKIAIVYEPNTTQFALNSANLDINKQYMIIVDLQETQDFEICVHMAHPREWIPTITPQSNITRKHAVGVIGTFLHDFSNGCIAVYALTALQSPNSSPVEINLYMRSEDMHFNAHRNGILNNALMTESGAEIEVPCLDLNQKPNEDGMISKRFFGEEPLSLRTLLKRFTTRYTHTTTVAGTVGTFIYSLPIIPKPGPEVNATDPYDINLLAYLRNAFLGYRGSVKWRFISYSRAGDVGWVRVTLSDFSDNTTFMGWSSDSTTVTQAEMTGTATFHKHTNGGVEVCVPVYSPNIFQLGPTNTESNSGMYRYARMFKIITQAVDNADIHSSFDCAIGEDFQFVHFLGAPPFTSQ